MIYPKHIELKAKVYEDFINNILPRLDEICEATVNDPNSHLQIAIMEAANNAARYSLAGLEEAEITVKITIHMRDISICILGNTKDWDVERFVSEARKLAYSTEWHNKNFGEFKGDRLSGRGIWLMLEACEYLYIDSKTKAVTMAVSYPFNPNIITQKMHILIDRLHVLRNGVIA